MTICKGSYALASHAEDGLACVEDDGTCELTCVVCETFKYQA